MKKSLRILFQGICGLAIAAGVVVALISGFVTAALLTVWQKEGLAQSDDRTMLLHAGLWFAGALGVIAMAEWLRFLSLPDKTSDLSLRLVESKSPRVGRLVSDVFGMGLFIVLSLQLSAQIVGTPVSRVLTIAGWLTTLFLGLHLRILLHELGHLTAAIILRLNPRQIQVGIGPLLWSRTLATSLRLEWRAWPSIGFVMAGHRYGRNVRSRHALFFAAGPLTDALLLSAGFYLIKWSFGGLGAAYVHGGGGLTAVELFWITAISSASGLIPFKTSLEGTKIWTDGYGLLFLVMASRKRTSEFTVIEDWQREMEGQTNERRMERECSEGSSPPSAGDLSFEEQRARLASPLLPAIEIEETRPICNN